MAAFEYLKQYSTFSSVEEMDQHVEQHIQQHYFNLTESERAIVFKLASRSLEYPGASHLKASTIAESLEISTKTVYRAIKKLVELNIIEKVEGKKLNGIKGASIYKILHYNVPSEVSQRAKAEKPYESKVENGNSEKQPLISSNQKRFKDNNTYATQSSDNVPTLSIDKKDQTPYQQLKSFVKCFIDDNKLVYKLYGIWLAQTKSMISKDVPFDLALKAARYTMNAVKTKGVKSITGYFHGTLNNLIGKFLEEQICMYQEDWTLALDTNYEQHELLYVPEVEVIEEDLTTDDVLLNAWLDEVKDEEQAPTQKVPFYDWLNEREDVPQVNRYKPIENWLEW